MRRDLREVLFGLGPTPSMDAVVSLGDVLIPEERSDTALRLELAPVDTHHPLAPAEMDETVLGFDIEPRRAPLARAVLVGNRRHPDDLEAGPFEDAPEHLLFLGGEMLAVALRVVVRPDVEVGLVTELDDIEVGLTLRLLGQLLRVHPARLVHHLFLLPILGGVGILETAIDEPIVSDDDVGLHLVDSVGPLAVEESDFTERPADVRRERYCVVTAAFHNVPAVVDGPALAAVRTAQIVPRELAAVHGDAPTQVRRAMNLHEVPKILRGNDRRNVFVEDGLRDAGNRAAVPAGIERVAPLQDVELVQAFAASVARAVPFFDELIERLERHEGLVDAPDCVVPVMPLFLISRGLFQRELQHATSLSDVPMARCDCRKNH